MRIERRQALPPTAEKPEAAPVQHEVEIRPVAVNTMFTRMRSGAIDVKTYLNHKVEEATSHLRGLAPGERSFIQAELRWRLETDLAHVVRLATT